MDAIFCHLKLSSCLPGALARGDAAINLRFPHSSYREKIWDHVAGALIVKEAGGKISDASGGVNLLQADHPQMSSCQAQHPALSDGDNILLHHSPLLLHSGL